MSILQFLLICTTFCFSSSLLMGTFRRSTTSGLVMSSTLSPAEIRRLGTIAKQINEEKVWWAEKENPMTFSCTGCGRCCQNEGEVWFNSDEFADLVRYKNMPAEEVLDTYSDEVLNGWVKMKNKKIDASITGRDVETEGCIFLEEDGKKCGIYGARPIQCRTYPWWPKLLFNETMWNKEACLPDNGIENRVSVIGDIGDLRKWTPEGGGCEGINNHGTEGGQNSDGSLQMPTSDSLEQEKEKKSSSSSSSSGSTDTAVIYRNMALYSAYTDAFPFTKNGQDRERVLQKAEVAKSVVKATEAWVDDFVVKYDLCPFAESVFQSGRIRYRTHFGDSGRVEEKYQIIDRLRFEILDLLNSDEEQCATTLLTLPFAFQSFEEFYEFSVQIEDEVLPLLEKELAGPHGSRSAHSSTNHSAEDDEEEKGEEKGGEIDTKKRRNLTKLLGRGRSNADSNSNSNRSDNKNKKSSESESESEGGGRRCPVSIDTNIYPNMDSHIQLAFFHPAFAWAGTEHNEPINFEKRAPFPTINLLRAKRVREYADEARTEKIAGENVASLDEAGSERLTREFADIIRMATGTGA